MSSLSSRLWRVLALAVLAFIGVLIGNAQQPESPEADQPESRPNIVFIFTDDLGYGDIGAFGANDIATPNIDRIAERGVLFPEFYAASPVCTPSRAALLTGRYPVRMGIHHVFHATSHLGMPESEVTIAELLQDAGYATAIVGKWHLGHREKYLPLNQGFDEFFGIPYSNDMSPLPLMKDNGFVEDKVDQTMLTSRLTSYAVDFIDRHSQAPFFLYIPHPMPHVPLFASNAFEGVSERGLYGDVVEEIDASVGQIVSALERNGLSENTLLVFTSDNGPWLLMGEDGGSAHPLRNGKGTTFEGGMRVPTMAMYPELVAPGTVYNAPATMLDWLPTIAALTGVSLPAGHTLDGEDLSSGLSGGNQDVIGDRTLAYYSHGRLEALRFGDWKLKRPYSTQGNPVPAPLRLFLGGEIGLAAHDTLLFNLKDDPEEHRDLAKKHPEKVTELEAMMVAFELRIGEPPANITPLGLEASPAIGVLISAAVKLALLVLACLLILVSLLAFWLGRRSRRKKTS